MIAKATANSSRSIPTLSTTASSSRSCSGGAIKGLARPMPRFALRRRRGRQGCSPFRARDLLGAVGAIAGIAETGHDVGVVVEPFVDGGEPDRHVRVNAAHTLDALRRADQAH